MLKSKIEPNLYCDNWGITELSVVGANISRNALSKSKGELNTL